MSGNLTLTQKLNLANAAGYRIRWEPFNSWVKLYWYTRPDGHYVEVKGGKTQDKDSVIEAMYQDWKSSQITETHTDCRSETGITVSLVDCHYHDGSPACSARFVCARSEGSFEGFEKR